jgi:hypothetical protein
MISGGSAMNVEDMKKVQVLLSNLGLYTGAVDGLAGPLTRAAVRSFQTSHGLIVDGLVGKMTWGIMFPPASPTAGQSSKFYQGTAIRKDPDTVAKVAGKIGLDPAAFQAVCSVESSGYGYDSKSRVLVLYEPHIAYKLTYGPVRGELVREGLAYSSWGQQPYPKLPDERLQQVDECGKVAGQEIAAQSASWGLAQIMGFNHASAGYASAVEMVRSFAQSEENQLSGLATFLLNNHVLFQALQNHDWESFAEGYNGAGYRQNAYDSKLAEAYKKAKAD